MPHWCIVILFVPMPKHIKKRLAKYVRKLLMNYTLTKVSGFWEHEVVFRMLYQYSEYLTYRTPFFYQG